MTGAAASPPAGADDLMTGAASSHSACTSVLMPGAAGSPSACAGGSMTGAAAAPALGITDDSMTGAASSRMDDVVEERDGINLGMRGRLVDRLSDIAKDGTAKGGAHLAPTGAAATWNIEHRNRSCGSRVSPLSGA